MCVFLLMGSLCTIVLAEEYLPFWQQEWMFFSVWPLSYSLTWVIFLKFDDVLLYLQAKIGNLYSTVEKRKAVGNSAIRDIPGSSLLTNPYAPPVTLKFFNFISVYQFYISKNPYERLNCLYLFSCRVRVNFLSIIILSMNDIWNQFLVCQEMRTTTMILVKWQIQYLKIGWYQTLIG